MIRAAIEYIIVGSVIYSCFDYVLGKPFLYWTTRPVILVSSAFVIVYFSFHYPGEYIITGKLF